MITIQLDQNETRMLLEAAKSFREADKDFIDCETDLFAPNDKTIERWDTIISKLKPKRKRVKK